MSIIDASASDAKQDRAARFPARPDAPQASGDSVVPISRRARRFALSKDGSRLAVARTYAVEIWDLGRLECVSSLPLEGGRPPGTLALFFDSDDALAIVGRHDQDTAHLVTWDVVSHQMINRRILHMPGAARMARMMVTADARHLVGVSGTETIVVRLDGSHRSTNVRHGSYGQALAVSVDGRMAATCSEGGIQPAVGVLQPVVRVWSLPNLHQIYQWNLWELGCRDIACALAFAPDGRRLILGGWEGVLRRLVLPDL
jgi:hypothetical protein